MHLGILGDTIVAVLTLLILYWLVRIWYNRQLAKIEERSVVIKRRLEQNQQDYGILKTNNVHLVQTNQELQAALERNKEDLKPLRVNNGSLLEQNETLHHELESLRLQLSDAVVQNEMLQNQLETQEQGMPNEDYDLMAVQLLEAQEKEQQNYTLFSKLEAKNAQLEQAFNSLAQEKIGLETEKENLQEALTTLEETTIGLENKQANLLTEIASLEAANALGETVDQESALEEMEEQALALTIELESIKTENNTLQTQLANLLETQTSKQTQIDGVVLEKEKLNAQLVAEKAHNETLSQQLADTNEELAEKAEQLLAMPAAASISSEKQQELERLQTLNEAYRRDIAQMTSYQAKYETANLQLQELERLKREATQLEQQRDTYRDLERLNAKQLETVNKELEKYRLSYETSITQNKELQVELQKWLDKPPVSETTKEEVAAYQSQIDSLEKQIASHLKQIDFLETKMGSYPKQIELLKEKLGNYPRQVEQLEHRVKLLAADKQDLMDMLAEESGEIGEVKSEPLTKEKEHSRTQKVFSALGFDDDDDDDEEDRNSIFDLVNAG